MRESRLARARAGTRAAWLTRSAVVPIAADEIHYLVHWLVAAYLLFDPETNGSITKDVVEGMMEEKGHHAGARSFLTGERWKEMDWDKNGSISFAEFCFAFTGWVSVEYAEED